MVTSKTRLRIGLLAVAAVNDAEHDGDEEQRGDGGEDEAADNGAPERRILLTAISQA